MTVIIFTIDNGASVAVIHPAPGVDIADCVKNVPLGAKYKYMDSTELPQDRVFRGAWEAVVDNNWIQRG